MPTFISGLSNEHSLPFLDADTLQWLPPDDFFRHAQAPEASEPDQQWIWLYRAPWTQLLVHREDKTAIADMLAQWRHEQRTVLNLRPKLGSRLVLINIDQVDVQEIRARLGLASGQDDPPHSPAEEASLPPATATCAARLFEWCQPRDWDLFEALEASAWHGQGKPCFRQDITPPDDPAFMDVLRTIQNGLGHPILRDQFQKAEQKLERLHAERDDQAEKLSRVTDEHRELTQENELLLAQLHQVQEELERYYLANQELIAGLDRSSQTMHQARKAISHRLTATPPRQQGNGRVIVSL